LIRVERGLPGSGSGKTLGTGVVKAVLRLLGGADLADAIADLTGISRKRVNALVRDATKNLRDTAPHEFGNLAGPHESSPAEALLVDAFTRVATRSRDIPVAAIRGADRLVQLIMDDHVTSELATWSEDEQAYFRALAVHVAELTCRWYLDDPNARAHATAAGVGDGLRSHDVQAETLARIEHGLDQLPDRITRAAGQTSDSDSSGRESHRPTRPYCDVEPDAVDRYLAALSQYSDALPRWFSPGLKFIEIKQDVLIRLPMAETQTIDADLEEAPAEPVDADPQDHERARPIPLDSALLQHQAVLLLGKPGSGKSWAIRGRCLTLALQRLADGRGAIPVPVIAAKVEERIASISRATPLDLPRVLAESMPEELVAEESMIETVAALIAGEHDVELLLDGYDEVGEEIPHLDRYLAAIIRLTRSSGSRLIMTSRPTSVPKQSATNLMATMVLQPFSEREQLAFVDTWFAGDQEHALRVKRWITVRRLDLLKTPLLIALLCAVTKAGEAPPESEPALLYRVLTRLSSDEERYEEVEREGRLVELRVGALERIALSYVDDSRINESISGSEFKKRNEHDAEWQALATATRRSSVLDDLTSTGLLQRSVRGQDIEVRFLHNEIRDYLIARALRNQDWRPFVDRIWAQPQWEPPIAYVAAVLDEPDELLLALERRFDADPLNTARFVAGRAAILAGDRLSAERRVRTRDQLLILLGSHDAVDRGRAAELLASFSDNTTAEMVRSFITPAAPTRVVTAALGSIAGVDAAKSVRVLRASAIDDRFVASEREAAVEALGSVGSSEAVGALEYLARETGLDPRVRAVAAFEALRRLSVETVARELLTSADEGSREARWGLAERVGAQRQSVATFVDELGGGRWNVPDPYCRALLATEAAGPGSVDLFALAPAIPSNPALDLLTQSVEVARSRMDGDPLWETPGRCVLDERQPLSLRWLVACEVVKTDSELLSALDFWKSVLQRFDPTDRIALVDFLLAEVEVLPVECSTQLLDAMVSGRLGALAFEEANRARDRATSASPAETKEPTRAEVAVDDVPLKLEEIFADGSNGWTVHYQSLRGLRRTLPSGGPVFQSAASLTHAITVVGATNWIDAQPLLANAVEERLLKSRHQWAQQELVRLRTTWPARQEEVPDTAVSYQSSVLESRAWAALLDDDVVEAASMALASIGAERASDAVPSELTARILFAAGMLSGRMADTFEQVNDLLSTFDQHEIPAPLLRGWLLAVVRPPAGIGDYVKSLVPRSFDTEAESVALRCLAGVADFDEFQGVSSWSACVTAARLLQAVADARREGTVRENGYLARAAAIARAAELARSWPPPATQFPSEQGRPRWQRQLVDIAVELLNRGIPAGAAVVFRAALRERPNSAELTNNLGFCLVPVDRDEALQQLDLAATLYPKPFAVNVANRMVLRFHQSDSRAHAEARAIADTYRIRATTTSEISSGYLWDVDTLSLLTDVPDLDQYISDLAQRLALGAGDMAAVESWQRWDTERLAAFDLADLGQRDREEAADV